MFLFHRRRTETSQKQPSPILQPPIQENTRTSISKASPLSLKQTTSNRSYRYTSASHQANQKQQKQHNTFNKMCNFTPYLFRNCHCPSINTGALELCAAATRTGEKCSRPKREMLQKRPGECGPCKQKQVSKDNVKARLGLAKAVAAGREDSVVDTAGISAETASIAGTQGTRRSGRARKAVNTYAREQATTTEKVAKTPGKGKGKDQGRSGTKVTSLPSR